MRRLALSALAISAAVFTLAAARPADWRWDITPGLAPPPVPASNPMSGAKFELGRRLFYDADLSINGTMSCATCHEQKRGFADGNATRPGVHGDPGRRNVPGLMNVAYAAKLTWADPRLTALEVQVAIPVLGEHPVEMGMKGNEAEVSRRLGRDRCYARMFASAFPESGGTIDMVTVAKALAAFQRAMVSFDTPFDRFSRGQADAILPAARRGADIFQGRGGCASCHAGLNFSDGRYHALDVAARKADRGLREVTGSVADDGRFRTPGLRNVALTAPYMHDGSAPTLDAALQQHQAVLPGSAYLTETDRRDLAAFLGALTDRRFLSDPRFSLPAIACGKRL